MLHLLCFPNLLLKDNSMGWMVRRIESELPPWSFLEKSFPYKAQTWVFFDLRFDIISSNVSGRFYQIKMFLQNEYWVYSVCLVYEDEGCIPVYYYLW